MLLWDSLYLSASHLTFCGFCSAWNWFRMWTKLTLFVIFTFHCRCLIVCCIVRDAVCVLAASLLRSACLHAILDMIRVYISHCSRHPTCCVRHVICNALASLSFCVCVCVWVRVCQGTSTRDNIDSYKVWVSADIYMHQMTHFYWKTVFAGPVIPSHSFIHGRGGNGGTPNAINERVFIIIIYWHDAFWRESVGIVSLFIVRVLSLFHRRITSRCVVVSFRYLRIILGLSTVTYCS